jgi:hypothetical protein
MASPSEKLANSLEELQKLQKKGHIAIRSQDLSRTHRERLQKAGFIQSVIKGWYIPSRPDETAGESTAWYAAFWTFCSSYLNSRFKDDWSLSPEQSLAIHVGNWTVPRQLLVRTGKPTNNVTALPHGTALLDIHASIPAGHNTTITDGLRLFSLPSALIAGAPDYFRRNATDARAALSLVRDASEILEPLLEGGHSTIAGRLAGAFRNIGKEQIADAIIDTMRAAGYTVKEADPFDELSPMIISNRERSPYVSRIQLMWQTMRQTVLEHFPPAPGITEDKQAYMKQVDDIYVTDAYHSLSIEGYRVNAELIEKVRSGDWNPDDDQEDRQHRDALAARGYWLAFQSVKNSIEKILDSTNPGEVVERDHGAWYRELFAPSVTAGILKPADLAGYRTGPVYIRRSMHTPLNRDALRDAMPAFLELLADETEPAVRVVLGHFIFVYIHPYMDGNGRMGRFLMNAMLASGGYPWTVIPLERRDDYMAALESASVEGDIAPFTRFLVELVSETLR